MTCAYEQGFGVLPGSPAGEERRVSRDAGSTTIERGDKNPVADKAADRADAVRGVVIRRTAGV
jgi:hypothetical protein